MAQFTAQDLVEFLEAFKTRASLLLAVDDAEAKSTNAIWPSGQSPTVISSKAEETIWQECLTAFGRCFSPSQAAGKHFMKVIEVACDANRVLYPHQIFRIGFPRPRPMLPCLESESAALGQDINTCEFHLPGQVVVSLDTMWSPDELEVGQKWINCLAKSAVDLRDSMHVDTNSFDTTLLPWPMITSSSIAQDESAHPRMAEDPVFFESGRYLRDHMHQEPQQLDLSLSEWRVLPENVINDDICTECQLKMIDLRASRGPLSTATIEKRRIKVDPRFFEEIRPTLEKDAALAEMHARWARDKAKATRDHDEAADYGAQFVAWRNGNERRWPQPSRAWLQHGRWFAMWRNSRQAVQSEARKLRAKKRSDKAIDCADSDASWEALSVCSDSSWQAVSELSDASWLELATDSDIVAHISEKESIMSKLNEGCTKDLELVLPMMQGAVEALNCLRKGDLSELKALAKPPEGVKLVAKALCYCFSMGPKKEGNSKFDFWPLFQKLIADMSFLLRLCAFDKDNISEQILNNLLPFESDPAFQPEAIAKVSMAGKGLCMWVRAIIVYARISKELGPRRKALRQAELDLEIVRQALANRTHNEIPPADERMQVQTDCTEEKAAPALAAALKALEMIDKSSIAEMRGYVNPPEMVKKTMYAVMTVMEKTPSWNQAKREMTDVKFLDRIMNFDKDGVTDATLRKIREYTEDSNFTPNLVCNVSAAAAALCRWVHAVKVYAEVYREVEQCKRSEDANLHSPCSTTVPSPASWLSLSPLSSPEKQPLVQAASLPTVDMKAIRELKGLSHPPGGIAALLSAVMELQAGINPRIELDESGGVKDLSWKAAQKLMRDVGQFAQDLEGFEDAVKAGKVPRANFENAFKLQQQHGDDFCLATVSRKSFAAAGVAQWLAAMLARFDLVAVDGVLLDQCLESE